MSQRVRLAVLFLVNAPITTATVPRGAYGPTRKSGGFAARHVPHGICLKGSGPMLGLFFDAEQGCWWSVCIHGRSRYCRLLKTFVVVIGKSEHEAARRILM